jgi:hypothetical protein
VGRCKQQHRHGRANHPVSRTTPWQGREAGARGLPRIPFWQRCCRRGISLEVESPSRVRALSTNVAHHTILIFTAWGGTGAATRRGREEWEAHTRVAMRRAEAKNRHRGTQKERPARRVGKTREEPSSHRHGAVTLRCAQRQR